MKEFDLSTTVIAKVKFGNDTFEINDLSINKVTELDSILRSMNEEGSDNIAKLKQAALIVGLPEQVVTEGSLKKFTQLFEYLINPEEDKKK